MPNTYFWLPCECGFVIFVCFFFSTKVCLFFSRAWRITIENQSWIVDRIRWILFSFASFSFPFFFHRFVFQRYFQQFRLHRCPRLLRNDGILWILEHTQTYTRSTRKHGLQNCQIVVNLILTPKAIGLFFSNDFYVLSLFSLYSSTMAFTLIHSVTRFCIRFNQLAPCCDFRYCLTLFSFIFIQPRSRPYFYENVIILITSTEVASGYFIPFFCFPVVISFIIYVL